MSPIVWKQEASFIRIYTPGSGIHLDLRVHVLQESTQHETKMSGNMELYSITGSPLAEKEFNWSGDNGKFTDLADDLIQALEGKYSSFDAFLAQQFIEEALKLTDSFVSGDLTALQEYLSLLYEYMPLRITCNKETIHEIS